MHAVSIIFLDGATLNRGDLDLQPLSRLGSFLGYPITLPAQTVERIRNAEIVLTNKVRLGRSEIDAAQKLKMIAVCATGTDIVDLEAAKERRIVVSNVAGYSTRAVAQHAFAFILNWATQMHRWVAESSAWSKAPIFTRLDYPLVELSGKSLGLVGTGRIGREVGLIAESMGMKVRALDRESKGSNGATSSNISDVECCWERLPMKALFEISDVISLHCPLRAETHHLINRETLGWMKKNSFLVNTARGGLIDEVALREALESGRLGGAGLDVLTIEPPPSDHPLLTLRHPNLLITPHAAWTPLETRKRLLAEVVANIEAFRKGEDRNRVV
jgi:glycerate dehydrogenase